MSRKSFSALVLLGLCALSKADDAAVESYPGIPELQLECTEYGCAIINWQDTIAYDQNTDVEPIFAPAPEELEAEPVIVKSTKGSNKPIKKSTKKSPKEIEKIVVCAHKGYSTKDSDKDRSCDKKSNKKNDKKASNKKNNIRSFRKN